MAEFKLPDLPEPSAIAKLLVAAGIILLSLGAVIGGAVVWFLK